jgi:hypothetical protein
MNIRANVIKGTPEENEPLLSARAEGYPSTFHYFPSLPPYFDKLGEEVQIQFLKAANQSAEAEAKRAEAERLSVIINSLNENLDTMRSRGDDINKREQQEYMLRILQFKYAGLSDEQIEKTLKPKSASPFADKREEVTRICRCLPEVSNLS